MIHILWVFDSTIFVRGVFHTLQFFFVIEYMMNRGVPFSVIHTVKKILGTSYKVAPISFKI